MAKELKIIFSGDTTTYRKEVDKAAVATQKFQKDAGSSINSLASVFGLNIGEIQKNMKEMNGRFNLLLTSMKASGEGATAYKAAMQVVKVATISTGIGALVVVLGSLVTYFTQTREGANFVKSAMAGLGAVVRTLIDHFSSFGEGIFKLFKGDWAGSMAAFKSSFTGLGSEMVNNAKAAFELERQTQALNKTERETELINAKRRSSIEELRKEAKEFARFDAKTREDKMNEALRIEGEIYRSEKKVAEQRLSIHKSQSSLRKQTSEDIAKETELTLKLEELKSGYMSRQKEYYSELKEMHSQTAAAAKAAEDAILKKRKEQLGERPDRMGSVDIKVKSNIEQPNELLLPQWWRNQQNSARIAMENMKANSIDFSNTFRQAFANAAEGFGEFIGNLISGEADIQDFGSFIAGSFADLATTIGKQMIAFGVAGIALQKLTINPWAALAAGVALIALGTAAKNAVSKSLAGGGGATTSANQYSGPSGGGSSYGSSTPFNSAASAYQNVNITVGGKFELEGGKLVAAISQENQRKAIVT